MLNTLNNNHLTFALVRAIVGNHSNGTYASGIIKKSTLRSIAMLLQDVHFQSLVSYFVNHSDIRGNIFSYVFRESKTH